MGGKAKNKANVSAEDLEEIKKAMGLEDDPDEDTDEDDDAGDGEKEDIGLNEDNEDNDSDEEEDADSEEEKDEEDEESEEPEEEPEEEEPEEATTKKKPGKPDKKDSAIISLKKEIKELRTMLIDTTTKLQERDYSQELVKLTERYTQEFIDDGMAEDRAKIKAKSMAEGEVEKKQVADRLFDIEIERLEDKGYKDVRSKATVLKPLVKAGLTLEEAYRAKYGAVKEKEVRTKTELLAATKKQHATTKKAAAATGSSKTVEAVKLSKRDERIYNEISKNHGGMFKNRKEFANILKDFTNEE
jgi:hypothetical protein